MKVKLIKDFPLKGIDKGDTFELEGKFLRRYLRDGIVEEVIEDEVWEEEAKAHLEDLELDEEEDDDLI